MGEKELERWIIEEGRCVTKISLLRQTSLSTCEIERLMSEFYEKHKELTAVYLVLGMKKTEDGLIRQSVLCQFDVLDKVKSEFEKVLLVSIHSLHRNSTSTAHNILNTTWSGKYEKPVEPYEHRLRIVSDHAVGAAKAREKRRPKASYSSYVIPAFGAEPEPTTSISSDDTMNVLVFEGAERYLKESFEALGREKMEVDAESNLKRRSTEKDSNALEPTSKKSKSATTKKKGRGSPQKPPPNQMTISSFFSHK